MTNILVPQERVMSTWTSIPPFSEVLGSSVCVVRGPDPVPGVVGVHPDVSFAGLTEALDALELYFEPLTSLLYLNIF